MNTATISVHGDSLTVNWTGSVWVSPVTGRQHSREWDALADELRAYERDSGEDYEHIDGQFIRANYAIVRG